MSLLCVIFSSHFLFAFVWFLLYGLKQLWSLQWRVTESLKSTGNTDLKSQRKQTINAFYRRNWRCTDERKACPRAQSNHAVVRETAQTSEGRGAISGFMGTRYWHFGPDSSWFLAPPGSGGHSTLLLSAHLLLSLCVVSEHLIAVSSQNHWNRKEGFTIWTQGHRIRVQPGSERMAPKAMKVTQPWNNPSTSLKQECLWSLFPITL